MSLGRRSLGGLVFPFWSRAVTVAAQVISGDGCVGGCGIVCVVVGRSRARVRHDLLQDCHLRLFLIVT